MNARIRYCAFGLVSVLLLLVACGRESTPDKPVVTTTNQGTTTAPPAKEAEKSNAALIRAVNAIPDLKRVDLFADEERIIVDIPYKEVSHYKEIPDVRHTFIVREAGRGPETVPLAENSENLAAGDHYTFVALGGLGAKPGLYVYADNLTPPPPGRAKVRVIHASPGAGGLDVYAKERNVKLFSNVNVTTEAGYDEVDPMTVTLEVRPAGKSNPVITVPNMKFEAEKIYTVLIMGQSGGTPPLEAFIIEDLLGPPITPGVVPSPGVTSPPKS
jgi:hypothetical protein